MNSHIFPINIGGRRQRSGRFKQHLFSVEIKKGFNVTVFGSMYKRRAPVSTGRRVVGTEQFMRFQPPTRQAAESRGSQEVKGQSIRWSRNTNIPNTSSVLQTLEFNVGSPSDPTLNGNCLQQNLNNKLNDSFTQ